MKSFVKTFKNIYKIVSRIKLHLFKHKNTIKTSRFKLLQFYKSIFSFIKFFSSYSRYKLFSHYNFLPYSKNFISKHLFKKIPKRLELILKSYKFNDFSNSFFNTKYTSYFSTFVSFFGKNSKKFNIINYNLLKFSRFFRILYNGSYLNFEKSNKALELLTKIEFKDGLVAGLPSEVPVAHKFGERQFGEEKQLHDYGIVYYPEKPYLICIMTRGKELSKLPHVISELSKVTYEEVSKK